jgi:hypothetical protein
MTEPTEGAGPADPRRSRRVPALRATWLVAMIAKRMVEHPDGTASVTLPAGMAGRVKDLIADTAKSS